MEKVCSEHVESIAVVDRHTGWEYFSMTSKWKKQISIFYENIDFWGKTGSRKSKKGCKSSPYAKILCQNNNIPSDLRRENHNTMEML